VRLHCSGAALHGQHQGDAVDGRREPDEAEHCLRNRCTICPCPSSFFCSFLRRLSQPGCAVCATHYRRYAYSITSSDRSTFRDEPCYRISAIPPKSSSQQGRTPQEWTMTRTDQSVSISVLEGTRIGKVNSPSISYSVVDQQSARACVAKRSNGRRRSVHVHRSSHWLWK
jgi:hypothetical protein